MLPAGVPLIPLCLDVRRGGRWTSSSPPSPPTRRKSPSLPEWGRNGSELQISSNKFEGCVRSGALPHRDGRPLTANRRFRSIADMDRFSSRNDL